MKLIHLKKTPISKQLELEEHLLKHTETSWCIINEGSIPTIVLGIAGKEEDFICPLKLSEKPIPIIKRFSGGGTVVVDQDTLFISFICMKKEHAFPAYPEPILRFAENIYKEGFGIEGFCLKENDFVIGEKKCGGNAQYIRKDNWLIHTSFLWDFDPKNMDYLLFPKKTPAYRAGRSHLDFLCTLKQFCPSKEELILRFKNSLSLEEEKPPERFF